MKKWFELKICLINPVNEKGVYDPKNAEVKDYIIVSLYEDFPFVFFKTLIRHIEILLIRNGILPED